MVQAIPTTPNTVPQYAGLRMSADAYLALPDDGFKYQVINGVVVMSPSPTPRHQMVLQEISGQLRDFLKSQPIARAFPDIDVRFGPDLVYRPDLVVIRKERLPRPLRRIDVVPDLIVEILSPGTQAMDQRTKLADYERLGVREYWIVSTDEPLTVRVLRLESGRYAETAGAPASAVLQGFTLNLEALREAARE
jgi:Uma2 family endonuclease